MAAFHCRNRCITVQGIYQGNIVHFLIGMPRSNSFEGIGLGIQQRNLRNSLMISSDAQERPQSESFVVGSLRWSHLLLRSAQPFVKLYDRALRRLLLSKVGRLRFKTVFFRTTSIQDLRPLPMSCSPRRSGLDIEAER